MGYRWKPSKSQRREFAIRMQDPEEKAAYEERKKQKLEKNRSDSKFDYEKAGGYFVPTKEQHDFCFNHFDLFQTEEQKNAANFVMSGFACNEKVHHDFIHIVNELRRQYSITKDLFCTC